MMGASVRNISHVIRHLGNLWPKMASAPTVYSYGIANHRNAGREPTPCSLETASTEENFDEDGYLAMNGDVLAAVRRGDFHSGRDHFQQFGKAEGRKQRLRLDPQRKKMKFERIRSCLRDDMPFVKDKGCYDFLTRELQEKFNIIDTTNVSSNGYDYPAQDLIRKHCNGLVLDCGAGLRGVYYDNVVNFEIVAYDTTDVRGVGEVLPFKDNVFDAVLSIAVLEHVKDPFQCAREIVRVLKPGGDLMCCVPFLQPLHGYPHHYYNMTHQGLRNLFCDDIEIDKVDCYSSNLPIWTLTWFLRSWADGLSGEARTEFLELKVADFLASPTGLMDRAFVTGLSHEKNLELACSTVLFGRKPKAA